MASGMVLCVYNWLLISKRRGKITKHKTVLVAGATGYLGRFVVAELHRRGHKVRALTRSRERAVSPGPWDSPSLDGLVDDWAIGEVTNPAFIADVAVGIDDVISTLGVTRQKANPWDIDHRANLAILRSAETHGVTHFCFVNVIGGDQCPAQLTRAKTAFAHELAASQISSQIINPPGYFSDMTQILQMARKGRVLLFRPDTRINPIHGADLATFCIDRLTDGKEGTWDVGGPEVFTWKGLAECAFQALHRPVRVATMSPAILSPLIGALRLFNRRRADTLRFISWNMLRDCVGEPFGTHGLLDFYKDLVQKDGD